MIEGITKKVMLGGIKKYAEMYNEDEADIQIRISHGDSENVEYEICNNWNPQEKVTFRDILNKKIDMFGYEQLATPYFLKSLKHFQELHGIKDKDISIFLTHLKKTCVVFVYNKGECFKYHSLSKHFQEVSIN